MAYIFLVPMIPFKVSTFKCLFEIIADI